MQLQPENMETGLSFQPSQMGELIILLVYNYNFQLYSNLEIITINYDHKKVIKNHKAHTHRERKRHNDEYELQKWDHFQISDLFLIC